LHIITCHFSVLDIILNWWTFQNWKGVNSDT